jgi:hypothetical protein
MKLDYVVNFDIDYSRFNLYSTIRSALDKRLEKA